MSTNSNDQGRAYEYAWMTALYKKLAAVRKTCVVANSSLDNAVASISADVPAPPAAGRLTVRGNARTCR